MKIRYTPEEEGLRVSKPYVQLVMCSQKNRIAVDGLIDSGADHNLFNILLAKLCGIDLRNAAEVRVTGFNHTGKKNIGYLVPVKYVLGNYEWIGDTIFVETKQPHGFLGQVGFFDAFDILFSYRRQTVDVQPLRAEKIDHLTHIE